MCYICIHSFMEIESISEKKSSRPPLLPLLLNMSQTGIKLQVSFAKEPYKRDDIHIKIVHTCLSRVSTLAQSRCVAVFLCGCFATQPHKKTRKTSGHTHILCAKYTHFAMSRHQCISVCCSVLQCVAVQFVAVCCSAPRSQDISVLQCVVVCCSVLQCLAKSKYQCVAVQCVAVCCSAVCCSVLHGSVSQCVAVQCISVCCSAVCRSVLQCSVLQCSVSQCVAVQCVAVCCSAVCRSVLQCSVLQCVAVSRPHDTVSSCVAVCCDVCRSVLQCSVLQYVAMSRHHDRHVSQCLSTATHWCLDFARHWITIQNWVTYCAIGYYQWPHSVFVKKQSLHIKLFVGNKSAISPFLGGQYHHVSQCLSTSRYSHTTKHPLLIQYRHVSQCLSQCLSTILYRDVLTLQHTATHCTATHCDTYRNTLQHMTILYREVLALQHIATHYTATHCNTWRYCIVMSWHCNVLQHTALQHTATPIETHCNTWRYCIVRSWHCNTLQHTALQHTATHIATHCNTWRYCIVRFWHCNTLQHTTLQHTATHIACFRHRDTATQQNTFSLPPPPLSCPISHSQDVTTHTRDTTIHDIAIHILPVFLCGCMGWSVGSRKS